jgi:uncharacterized protein
MNPKSHGNSDASFRTDLVISGPVLEKALSLGRLPAAGELDAASLPRLANEVAALTGPVRWSFRPDDQQPGPGRWRRRWWLTVQTEVVCACERCLAPVTLTIDGQRGFEFFESSAQADAHSERLDDEELAADPVAELVDYLSPEDGMTIALLVEDEVLLNMPMAPKHESCDLPVSADGLRPIGQRVGEGAEQPAGPGQQETTRPFEGLKDLLKKR